MRRYIFLILLSVILISGMVSSALTAEEKKSEDETAVLELEGEAPPGMVFVPAGEFLMGKDEGDDEKPLHKVYVDAFFIDKYEVTYAEYAEFVEAGGYSNKSYWSEEGWSWKEENYITEPAYWNDSTYNQPNYPMVGINWYEAEAYTRWCGKRLPTEAEWEKAARGTDGRRWPWGEDFESDKANIIGTEDGYEYTAPVGSYPLGVSPYGCYDMAGNVWEWCADWYEAGYYANSPSENPKGPDSGSSRVIRGGSWFNYLEFSRCADRNYNFPNYRNNILGFRCVLSVAP